jgi:hypothetical protein
MNPTARRNGRLILAALTVAVVVSVGISGCTPTVDQTKPSPTSSNTTPPDAPPSVTEIIDTPGSGEGFVGALADSAVSNCALADGTWKVDGTVTNPTEEPANYRIYVSLLNASGETRALQQVNVDEVDAAATSNWTATVQVADEGLNCVLRVERYTA